MKQSTTTTRPQRLSRGASWLALLLSLLLPIQPVLAGEITYYFPDASGSPVVATDAQGTVIWREHYAPYGDKLNEVCPMPCNGPSDYEDIGYTGHEYDQETGLTYMQARYYDPEVGRFLAIDPVGFKPNQPMTFNRYSYANNNPYKYHDPDGRIIDTIADVGFIIYDGYKIATEGATPTNMAALGADVTALFIPVGTGAGLAVRASAKVANKTETVQRVMSKAELAATKQTGKLRGGRKGIHHASDSANSNAKRAQQRLSLPQTPEVKATLEVPKGTFSKPTKVAPANNMPGGGMERKAQGDIPVRVLKEENL